MLNHYQFQISNGTTKLLYGATAILYITIYIAQIYMQDRWGNGISWIGSKAKINNSAKTGSLIITDMIGRIVGIL